MSNVDQLFAEVQKAEREEQTARDEYNRLEEETITNLEAHQTYVEASERLVDASARLDAAQAAYNDAAETEDEESLEFYRRLGGRTGEFILTDCDSNILEVGTLHECIRAYMRDDGRDYRFDPDVDEEGVQKTLSDGTLRWRLFVKERGQWRDTRAVAYGKTEEEAETELFNEYDKESVWTYRGRYSIDCNPLFKPEQAAT